MSFRKVKTLSPRIYLDVNVLISAILESSPVWLKKNNPDPKRRQFIECSHELYSHRQSLTMKTSTFAIAEFIAKGRTKEHGNRSSDDMVGFANSKILPKTAK